MTPSEIDNRPFVHPGTWAGFDGIESLTPKKQYSPSNTLCQTRRYCCDIESRPCPGLSAWRKKRIILRGISVRSACISVSQ